MHSVKHSSLPRLRSTIQNSRCFAIHKQSRHNGTSYCNQLFVCEDGSVFVSLLRREQQGAQHKCGETYWKICDAYVLQPGHLCYLGPLKPEPNPWRSTEAHIFRFWNIGKPEEGNTPTMVIAQYADNQEFRFPQNGQPVGDSEALPRQFAEWLFSKQHRECIIIAQNS